MNLDFFVQNIKARCRLMGITPTEACRKSGVGIGFMGNIKRGSSPSIDRIELLAKFFDCTVGELIGEDTSDLTRGPDQPYLVMRYNSFPPEVQDEVMAFIEFKVAQLAEKEATEKKKAQEK